VPVAPLSADSRKKGFMVSSRLVVLLSPVWHASDGRAMPVGSARTTRSAITRPSLPPGLCRADLIALIQPCRFSSAEADCRGTYRIKTKGSPRDQAHAAEH